MWPPPQNKLICTVCWLDVEPAQAGDAWKLYIFTFAAFCSQHSWIGKCLEHIIIMSFFLFLFEAVTIVKEVLCTLPKWMHRYFQQVLMSVSKKTSDFLKLWSQGQCTHHNCGQNLALCHRKQQSQTLFWFLLGGGSTDTDVEVGNFTCYIHCYVLHGTRQLSTLKAACDMHCTV